MMEPTIGEPLTAERRGWLWNHCGNEPFPDTSSPMSDEDRAEAMSWFREFCEPDLIFRAGLELWRDPDTGELWATGQEFALDENSAKAHHQCERCSDGHYAKHPEFIVAVPRLFYTD